MIYGINLTACFRKDNLNLNELIDFIRENDSRPLSELEKLTGKTIKKLRDSFDYLDEINLLSYIDSAKNEITGETVWGLPGLLQKAVMKKYGILLNYEETNFTPSQEILGITTDFPWGMPENIKNIDIPTLQDYIATIVQPLFKDKITFDTFN